MFEILSILKIIQPDIVTNVHLSYSNVSVLLWDFIGNWLILTDNGKNLQILNFIEIPNWKAIFSYRQTDGLTWRNKLWLLAISREHLNRCYIWRGKNKRPRAVDVSYCSLADTDTKHKMQFWAEERKSNPASLGILIRNFTIKTAEYLSTVTPILPPSKTVLRPNTQDNIKLHIFPCNASSAV